MLNLEIATLLGVVPPPQAPAPAPAPAAPLSPSFLKDWAPPCPVPIREYRVTVSRRQWGTVTVSCPETDSAYDHVNDGVIEWDDVDSDIEYEEVSDALETTPLNQDEIDAWETMFGHKYDYDGQPWCTDCHKCTNIVEDFYAEPDGSAWYCTGCVPPHLLSE